MTAYKDYPFFFGAKANTFENARALRKNTTESEKILWQSLKAKKFFGLKFRRQHPINQFIVDFFCDELSLVIEIDGSIHAIQEIKEYDEGREAMLREWELTVIRFTNEEVKTNINKVLEKIKSFIN